MGYTSGAGGYYIPQRYSARTPTAGRVTPKNTVSTGQALRNQLDYSSYRPSDVRSPLGLAQQLINNGVSRSAINNTNEFVKAFGDYTNTMRQNGVQQTQPVYPGNQNTGGGGSYGGGGGGGAGGLDQATFDWLMAQLQNKPLTVNYRDLDLPDPSQYMKWDPSLYNTTRSGITTGIEGIRGRANTAYDAAQGELQRYVNPYAAGPQQQMPNLYDRFGAMANANDAMGALHGAVGEGAQADTAMRNAYALMAGNDQARQAANLRALAGDRLTTEQNLGLEGNMLNLGVNMAEARGKTSFDQALQKAMLDTATQESMANYTRRNEVEQQNATTLNSWQQQVLQQILGLVGSKASGTKLPGDMSWLSLIAPGINVQGGSGPIPATV